MNLHLIQDSTANLKKKIADTSDFDILEPIFSGLDVVNEQQENIAKPAPKINTSSKTDATTSNKGTSADSKKKY